MPSTKNKLTQVRQEPPILQIGKNGLSSVVLAELQAQIKRHQIIKIRILETAPFPSKGDAFAALRDFLPGHIQIIETRGWTVILRKTV